MDPVRTAKIDIGTLANIEPFLSTVYEAYREALLKVKYSGYKLKWSKRINLYAEIVVAISTASGISGWAIWHTPGGETLWTFIAGAAAVIAAIKPLFRFSDNISTYSKLYSGYLVNYIALKNLVNRIANEHGFSREMEQEFEDLTRRYSELAETEALNEPGPSKKLRAKLWAEVNVEIPQQSLWYPTK
jgi:hypothetical protein